MKLALGTVQFGMPYGVSNMDGKTTIEEAGHILSSAALAGIDTLDTARAYGDSESVLGQLLPYPSPFRIVSKVPEVNCDPTLVKDSVLKSLEVLRVDFLDAVMFHRSSDLLGLSGTDCWNQLVSLRDDGKIGRIGLSAYSLQEIEQVLELFPLEIIQVPANILDQRFLKRGVLARLKEKNIEIHVRSAFLQGLLLMEMESISSYFNEIKPILGRWHSVCNDLGVSSLVGCLSFLHSHEEIDRIVVGVNTLDQLKEIVSAAYVKLSFDSSPFAIDDERFINPSCWKV